MNYRPLWHIESNGLGKNKHCLHVLPTQEIRVAVAQWLAKGLSGMRLQISIGSLAAQLQNMELAWQLPPQSGEAAWM